MSLAPDLESLCREWRALTEAEAGAIGAAAWQRVADLQRAKGRLQPAFREASAPFDSATNASPGLSLARKTLQGMLAELMALEKQNLASLARQVAAMQQGRRDLDSSAQNLRRLHRSYSAPHRGVWERYS
jgi:hypothetical protein